MRYHGPRDVSTTGFGKKLTYHLFSVFCLAKLLFSYSSRWAFYSIRRSFSGFHPLSKLINYTWCCSICRVCRSRLQSLNQCYSRLPITIFGVSREERITWEIQRFRKISRTRRRKITQPWTGQTPPPPPVYARRWFSVSLANFCFCFCFWPNRWTKMVRRTTRSLT